jgi:predicted Fe-Mo cluster-binding NifX family protein
MKVVVTSTGANLDAPASPVFGRCPTYILVDTETMDFEALPNPAINAAGGAGIQAAQYVTEQGVQAVLTGNVGPNAFDVLQAAGVPVYLIREGTVRQAVEAFKAGQLQTSGRANVQAHAGMGMGGRRGIGRGMGRGRGLGMGRGYGLGTTPPLSPSREQEVAALKDTARDLRQQLADVMARIERLEKES